MLSLATKHHHFFGTIFKVFGKESPVVKYPRQLLNSLFTTFWVGHEGSMNEPTVHFDFMYHRRTGGSTGSRT